MTERECDDIAALIAKLEQERHEIDDLLKRARAALAGHQRPVKSSAQVPVEDTRIGDQIYRTTIMPCAMFMPHAKAISEMREVRRRVVPKQDRRPGSNGDRESYVEGGDIRRCHAAGRW